MFTTDEYGLLDEDINVNDKQNYLVVKCILFFRVITYLEKSHTSVFENGRCKQLYLDQSFNSYK